jgi:hypothetical protein
MASARPGHFHNPYNFIPALEPELEGPLGQRAPVGHKAWYPHFFSGRIAVDIELVTPLIVPDASRAETRADGHVILPVLTENNDDRTPKLPPTSFKGALRSAYEAITNSRLSVFQGHKAPLGRRMEAGEGLSMVPARVSEGGDYLELYFGEVHPRTGAEELPFPTYNESTRRWELRNGVMYAAWLRQFVTNGINQRGPCLDEGNGIRYASSNQFPEHKDRVAVIAEKVNYNNGRIRFDYWSVVAIERAGKNDPPIHWNQMAPKRPYLGHSHRRVQDQRQLRGYGYVCLTGQNIRRKHDERVFFIPEGSTQTRVELKDEWRKQWVDLIYDYRRQAELPRSRRKGAPDAAYLGGEPGKTAFSRHVHEDSGDEKLAPETLCYARVNPRE